MALPSIKLNISNTLYGSPENGDLVYKYSPFQNLKDLNNLTGTFDLYSLSLSSEKAEIDISKPIDIETEESYDGSINLIINDKKNPLKMINSRFYLTDSNSYNIADRKGNLDTNIYTRDDFKIEAGLIKTVRSIISVDFLGISGGGRMSVGNYTFYFKLADVDGNESDFIAESGKVVCHIGDINQPKSIRGGQKDENSNKIIKFRLNNLDLAYDYINIYYTRSSGDGDLEVTKTYRVTDKVKINKLNTEISITGYENHEEINNSEINVQYATFDSTKTIVNCQNISFSGGITNNYEIYSTLEKYSLFITPEISTEENIGNLSHQYTEWYPNTGYEYYNANNIYYRLGYWDEEIYRFGIVYILNDYTLSPVFNIRGKNILNESLFTVSNSIDNEINYQEDYIIEGTNGLENAKGIFKIDLGKNILSEEKTIFNKNAPTKPIGLKFNFNGSVINGTLLNKGLKDLTKGFFIVRQKRVPTILAQSVGIGTSSKAYIPIIKGTSSTNITKSWFSESFLKDSPKPRLGNKLFPISNTNDSTYVNNNALLCPEAEVRVSLFNNFFNSSEYMLKPFKYGTDDKLFYDNQGSAKQFYLGNLKYLNSVERSNPISTSLTLIEPGIGLTKNERWKFSSQSGDAIISYKHSDPLLGDYENIETNKLSDNDKNDDNTWSLTTSKVRGVFNTFIGTESSDIQAGVYYNIYQKGYDFDANWKEYFKLRYNDSSPFMPVSDRIEWNSLTPKLVNNKTIYSNSKGLYRGDCYINTFTHRMNWNFVDPDLPTNKRIVDPYTWYKNFRVVKKASTTVNTQGEVDSGDKALSYRKLLSLFTYKSVFEPEWSGDDRKFDTGETAFVGGLVEPDGKKYKKYSEKNGVFGAEKLNRPDINAVPLGHWVTFKVCSNVNLAMRDLDFSLPEEEAVHGKKRGFYPLQSMDQDNHIPESAIINQGISKSLGDKYYFEVPDVPFIKTNFSTRIYYSNILQRSSFTNGNRVFEKRNFVDYTMEYGSLIKLVEWYGTIIAIMEHGILLIPVNERAMMANANGENVYINTETVLPKNPKVLSNTYGALYEDSIVVTPKFIYGIDTVGKKIWRTNGQQFEIISDMKIQKFLNDNLSLKESDNANLINKSYIKSHYNAFKQDIMFVFNYNNTKWNLCWNELISKWVTQYTWFPEFSENINNIFYTFADQNMHSQAKNYLYKHGFAGSDEVTGSIKPTYWYDGQHPFEYEFVVSDIPGVQKIFNNLKIVSNLAEPYSFFYEIVGEGFEWNKDKEKFYKFMSESDYDTYLKQHLEIKKLPFMISKSFDVNNINSFYNESRTYEDSNGVTQFIPKDVAIREHNKTKEKLVNNYQKGLDIKKYGRRMGNMQYLEDSWDIQIQPITFKYAYLNQGVFKVSDNATEMKIRDKYIKIRVKYDGTQYAIINALKTLYTISYA